MITIWPVVPLFVYLMPTQSHKDKTFKFHMILILQLYWMINMADWYLNKTGILVYDIA